MKPWNIAVSIFALILVAAGFLLPKSGPFTLAGEGCDILLLWLVCGYVLVKVRKSTLPKAGKILAGILGIGISLFVSRNLCLDLFQGPETIHLTDV